MSMQYLLSKDQREFWENSRFLHLPDFLSPEDKKYLPKWTQEITEFEDIPGKWMKYFEGNENQKQLCRIENFIPYHQKIRELFESSRLIQLLSDLMNEPAILFKEKINFKLPGGAGFQPHQDAPAFVSFNQKYHITMMLSVDDATIENGCLEIAMGQHDQKTLKQNEDGTISDEEVKKLNWQAFPMKAGDVLLFDSYLPHRSGPNMSSNSRRAYFVTYNKASEGCYRDEYFEHKRKTFPPDIERIPGVDYSKQAGIYNLGNPIK